MSVLSSILLWFQKAKPSPTERDVHTQIGCHFEEVAEMLDSLAALDGETADLLWNARDHLNAFSKHIKGKSNAIIIEASCREEFFDSLCDQGVTLVGVAYMTKLPYEQGLIEVDSSNWSKFVDGEPMFDMNGKIMKGMHYKKADLSRFVHPPYRVE